VIAAAEIYAAAATKDALIIRETLLGFDREHPQ